MLGRKLTMDFALRIDITSKKSIYVALAAAIRESIETGRMSCGQKLPSSLELAELMGLSRATVVKAYQQLIGEGYLDTKVGSGTYVKGNFKVAEKSADHAILSPKVSAHLSDFCLQLMDMTLSTATAGDLPELNFGAPPGDLLPVRVWQDMLLKYCRSREHKLEYRSDVFGFLPLREAIASMLNRSRGIECSADQVIVFSGAQQALNLIIKALVNPDDLVVVENPGYAGARDNFSLHGARVVAVDVDERGLQVEKLSDIAERVKLAYITLPHHDPTGATMDYDRRQQLLTWAKKTDALVIEDAWDSDYHYGNTAQPALQSLDRDGSVLYIYSFWKLLYPLVATGVLVVPRSLIPAFYRIKVLFERQFPTVEDYVLCEFIKQRYLERHIRRTRAIYKRLRQELIFELSRTFIKNITIPPYSGSLHQIVWFGEALRVSEAEVLRCAEEAGMPMVSTKEYYARAPKKLEFMIPFVQLRQEAIKPMVRELGRRLHGCRSERERN